MEIAPDEPLTIIQIVENDVSTVSADSVQEIAVSGFFVEDEDSDIEPLSINSFTRCIEIIQSVYCMATSLPAQRCAFIAMRNLLISISTTLTINSGYSVTSLYHVYECNVPREDDYKTSSVITDPSANFPYTFYSSSEYLYKNTVGPAQSFVG